MLRLVVFLIAGRGCLSAPHTGCTFAHLYRHCYYTLACGTPRCPPWLRQHNAAHSLPIPVATRLMHTGFATDWFARSYRLTGGLS